MKKLTTEEFVKKAKSVHGNKYDYSKTVYVHSKKKVVITCPIHGDFSIRANHHLDGVGCHKCAKENADKRHTLTTSQFIEKATSKHGDRYDYSLVDYVNTKTPVLINCKVHGGFMQKPSDHLLGCNCPKCSFVEIGKKRTSNTENFIQKAREVHGNRYDYSETEYFGYDKKLKIICPEHGAFWQTPTGHISNYEGCPVCGRQSIKNKLKNTLETFIEKACQVHKNKYDYSAVKYENCYSKVKIICPKHGVFEQTPKNHLSGAGCPKCNISKMENKTMVLLDDLGIEYEYQKRFPKWLKYQSLDFYLPEYGIAIECQGAQHFFPVPFNKKSKEYSEKVFQKQKERDALKKNLCIENGVLLFYINYNENVELRIREILNECKK